MTYAETQRLEAAYTSIGGQRRARPTLALVLGSGLGALADTFEAASVVPYEEIEGMPRSSVPGHAGRLVFGRFEGVEAVAMQGRVHLYEGFSPLDVVFGVRLMRRLGAEVLLVTNAAGGIAERLEVGSLMRIEDHLNLTGRNPLVGPEEPGLGERFVDMTEAYDRRLGALAESVAEEQGVELHRGVYAGLLGPSYETPAEIRMLRTLGADAVGMSTVLEVIAARQMGMRVLGISCITNRAAGLSETPLSHEEVADVAARVEERFGRLVRGVARRLGEE